MNILVTGAKGFIGKNLIAELKNRGYSRIFEFDKDDDISKLEEFSQKCDFVFHLAGINRPQREEEFFEGNVGFTKSLLLFLEKHSNKSPVLITSSIQAQLDNPYGKSKREAEKLIFEYGKSRGVRVLVYRLPNVFGKWSRPNYNSAIATFCYNISRDLPITVNDPNVVLSLVYIDDVVDEFIRALEGKETRNGEFCEVPIVYKKRLGDIVDLLYFFKKTRETLGLPDLSDGFVKKLYSTYLSFLPVNSFSYELKTHSDHRGSFTEFVRTLEHGQFSVNVIKPGMVKGNHWHHTKTEKFLVVYGEGVIRFRNIFSSEIIEYKVSGEKIQVVDIPPGYTHNIQNTGATDMVVLMWANEPFNPEKPDTYFLEV